MEKTIDLRGIARGVSTLYINRREYHTFLLICSATETYRIYVRHEDAEWDIEDGEHYSAHGFVVVGEQYLTSGIVLATSVDRWGRICDVCGKWHTEGYHIGECNYACSEECALHYYGGDKEAFEEDLALLDDPATADDADTYWTEWD